MSRRKMGCRLAYTDDRFVFGNRSYPGIPLLVDHQNQFVEPVCDYLRWRVVYGRLASTSARTYAEGILHFWNFLTDRGCPFDEIDDAIFLQWLTTQSGLRESTQAARCDAVFDLYLWMESVGYIHRMVRIPGINDQDVFTPRLSSRLARNGQLRRTSSGYGIVSALRPRQRHYGNLPTPGTDDIGKLRVAIDRTSAEDIAERNHLLLDWYLQTGLRRKEWRALTIEQLPSLSDVDAATEALHVLEIPLIETKGGRRRHAGALPELVERTWEYIVGSRADLVRRFREKYGPAYREPKEIFLSKKTGQPLEPKAISNLLSELFTHAGVDGHGHRLRATYLTRLFEAELMLEHARIAEHPGFKQRVDFELVLRRVAERAGHSSIDSLRPYLTIARKRIARQDGAEELLTIQQMLHSKRDALAHVERKLQSWRGALSRRPNESYDG